MKILIFKKKSDLAKVAAKKAAEILKKAIKTKGKAVFVAATGKSQIGFLDNLAKDRSIDWSKTIMFHLDEYIGIKDDHPASFRNYLKKRIIKKVHPGKVYLIDGSAKNPEKECKRLSNIISKEKIDVTFLGIGDDGHIAFNEPPADFQTKRPYITVNLSETTKKQELKERWFSRLSLVPKKAISMSVSEIMRSDNIIFLAPGKRKADIIKECFKGKINPKCPASIIRKHRNTFVFLDKDSASLLK